MTIRGEVEALLLRVAELGDGNAWPSTILLLTDMAEALKALVEENEELTKNINLKAEFIEKTLDQFAGEEERIKKLEARAVAAERKVEAKEETLIEAVLSAHKGEGG